VDMERVEEPLTTVRDRELASEAGVFDFDRDSRRNNRSHVRSGISLTSDMYTMDSSNMNPRHIRGSGSSLALTVGVADRLLEGVSVGRVKYTPWWTGRTWTSIPHTSNAASWSMMCHVNVGLRLSGVVTGRTAELTRHRRRRLWSRRRGMGSWRRQYRRSAGLGRWGSGYVGGYTILSDRPGQSTRPHLSISARRPLSPVG